MNIDMIIIMQLVIEAIVLHSASPLASCSRAGTWPLLMRSELCSLPLGHCKPRSMAEIRQTMQLSIAFDACPILNKSSSLPCRATKGYAFQVLVHLENATVVCHRLPSSRIEDPGHTNPTEIIQDVHQRPRRPQTTMHTSPGMETRLQIPTAPGPSQVRWGLTPKPNHRTETEVIEGRGSLTRKPSLNDRNERQLTRKPPGRPPCCSHAIRRAQVVFKKSVNPAGSLTRKTTGRSMLPATI